jgi:hypothetical protein
MLCRPLWGYGHIVPQDTGHAVFGLGTGITRGCMARGGMLVSCSSGSRPPGLGLKLGFRRGTVRASSSGRGDEVPSEAPCGGGRSGRSGCVAGAPFRVPGFRTNVTIEHSGGGGGLRLLLENLGGGAGIGGQPVEVFFRKRLRRVPGCEYDADGVIFVEDRDRQGVRPAGVRTGLRKAPGARHGQGGVGTLDNQVYHAPVRGCEVLG